MLTKVKKLIFGDMSYEEGKKFGILSCTFFCIIGSYWLLRTIKDAIFDSLVDLSYQPKAKMLSLVVIIPLVLFYTKLVDTFEKHKLFYIICSFYSVLFFVIAYFYKFPLPYSHPLTPYIPGSILGWISYVSIESFGSIVVALFWSFVASTTTTASAKRGYGLIFALGQLGAIGGPTLTTYASVLGLPTLTFMGGIAVGFVPVLMYIFMSAVSPEEMVSDPYVSDKKKKTGLFEGLRLILTRSYIMGILVVSTVYEVINTVIDYQLKALAKQTYGSGEGLAGFVGFAGQLTNVLAFILAIVGTSFFLRRFGVRFCLIAYPVSVGVAILYTYWFPSLYSVLIASMVIKGLSYTLNNPVKEVMYIPTSKDVKFKVKSWIDMFGSRSSKAAGALVSDQFARNIPALMNYGSLISLGIVGGWACVAIMAGTAYNTLMKEQKIVQ